MTVFSKNGAKFYLETSTTDEIALKQLSLTNEMPFPMCPKSKVIIYWRLAWTCSNFIPYKKLVRAAAECDTTLGTESLSKLINSGKTALP